VLKTGDFAIEHSHQPDDLVLAAHWTADDPTKRRLVKR
jgi:hypothetical protein